MLYKVQKRDITQAGKVLADAFQHDPIWSKICEGDSDVENRLRAIFEVSLRCGLKYGEVYSTSEDMEGIVAWIPGKYADMNTLHVVSSGAVGAVMRIGMKTSRKMGLVYKPLTDYRRENMDVDSTIYLLVLGVATEWHGKGFGGKLIAAAVEQSERKGLQLYVGAGSEENVSLYEHFGFKVVKKITLPIVNLPEWEMIREPGV